MTAERQVPLRRESSFRRFWLARAISQLGSAITLVAMPVLAYQVTGSPVVVSLVAAAETGGYLAFGLLAGAVADRVNRRRLMIASDYLNGICLASIPLASVLGVLTPGQIIAVALLSAALSVFFDAGVYGFVPAIVGRERLSSANSAVYGSQTVMRIVGTAAAGGLVALLHPAGTLAVDAVTFIASAILIRAIAYSPPVLDRSASGRPGLRKSVSEGLRFLLGHPVLRILTLVGTLQSFSGGAIIGQLVVFADRVLGLHGSDPRIGLLYTAWSAGGIGGTLFLPRLLRRINAFQVLLAALPVGAVLGLVVVLSSDWRIALVAIAAWSSTYLVVLVNTMTYSQQVTPSQLQSRVNTTRRMLSSGVGVPLGALVASTVTLQFTIRAGMLTAVASLGTAAVIVWAVQLKGVFSRPPEIEPAADR